LRANRCRIVDVLGRIDRYNHELEDDTDDTDDSPVFGLFSSCSPQYRKANVSKLSNVDLDNCLEGIKANAPLVTTPDTPDVPDFKLRPRGPISLHTPERERQEVATVEHRKVRSVVIVTKHPLISF
jgi:hypothetical protein